MPGRTASNLSDVEIENLVQKSEDYRQFKFMRNNRDVLKGHITSLKDAFEKMGNLTQVQPILVNENYEIIDGQHRFMAAKELGQPIYFTMRPGLRISDARSMNILHRNWNMMDFANSYADSGNRHYKKFLELKNDYDVDNTAIMEYSLGGPAGRQFARFRNGEFEIEDVVTTRLRLQQLSEAIELVPQVRRDRNFNRAFYKVSGTSAYDHRRMLRKLATCGDTVIRQFGNVQEYQRALEEAYNHGNRADNRVRLY